jgi:hypothetical protein
MNELESQLEAVITNYHNLKLSKQDFPLYNAVLAFDDLKMYKLFVKLIIQIGYVSISSFDLRSTAEDQNQLFELARKYIKNVIFI